MDMHPTVDFKKVMALELQINLSDINDESRFVFVTDSAFIEGNMNLQESDFSEESIPLGDALYKTEHKPNFDTKNMDVIHINACFYLKDVKMTPFANQNQPIYLDEFILFSDHVAGVTLL